MRPCQTLSALALACASAAVLSGSEKPPVPTYTNADLDRIAPYRGETGVLSTPASPLAAEPASRPSGPRHDETYWRHEADHLHDRIRALRQRADEIRFRLASPPRQSQGRKAAASASNDPTPALKARLAAIESEIRDRENRFEERARREGALPGWLR
jgi:hypothetical protein